MASSGLVLSRVLFTNSSGLANMNIHSLTETATKVVVNLHKTIRADEADNSIIPNVLYVFEKET